ncbi:MAG: FAD-dependent monooxygenase [Phycisphaeraceae bacterium]|nr:FAD-dependent monooxygenase [Phycisphaeraceae bacterium]
MPRVLIVGAGLVGALLAHELGTRGWQVLLVERRSDPRARGAVAGRSINLAISVRGFDALDRAGLGDRLRERAIRMPGRMIHPHTGAPFFQPYSRDPTRAIHSVSRSRLNMLLLEAAAAQPSVEIRFDRRALEVDFTRPAVSFLHEPTQAQERIEADMVIGADGAYSAIRAAMQRNERFDYQQSFLTHGYKELTIPALAEDADAHAVAPHAPFAMEPQALHIWPRGGSMMIALPNPEGSFTCTLFWPFRSPAGSDQPSFDSIRNGVAATEYFRAHYPDALTMMPTLASDFDANPIGTMVTIRCAPWVWDGRTALIGDAAHAIVPFYGQGANCGFEDAVALVAALDDSKNDIPSALAHYQERRMRHANAIADLALANFIEMRDKTASRLFHLRKKIDHTLHGLLPNHYQPLYDMVSFSTIPYDDARQRARRQDRALMIGASAVLFVIALLLLLFVWAVFARS